MRLLGSSGLYCMCTSDTYWDCQVQQAAKSHHILDTAILIHGESGTVSRWTAHVAEKVGGKVCMSLYVCL